MNGSRPRKKSERQAQSADDNVETGTDDPGSDPATQADDADRSDQDGADISAVTETTVSSDGESASDDERLAAYQAELIDRRNAAINNARRRFGTAGAAMAAVGLQLQEFYEGKKEDPAVIVEANSNPENVDDDGITVELDGTSYHAPPMERVDKPAT